MMLSQDNKRHDFFIPLLKIFLLSLRNMDSLIFMLGTSQENFVLARVLLSSLPQVLQKNHPLRFPVREGAFS